MTDHLIRECRVLKCSWRTKWHFHKETASITSQWIVFLREHTQKQWKEEETWSTVIYVIVTSRSMNWWKNKDPHKSLRNKHDYIGKGRKDLDWEGWGSFYAVQMLYFVSGMLVTWVCIVTNSWAVHLCREFF